MNKILFHHSILPPQYTSDKLHPKTLENIRKWISINYDLDIEQKIWTNEESRIFLRDNFGSDIIKYFDSQSDGRFKSDLWRLCVLFVYGGIYVDIDQEPLEKLSNVINFNKIDFCGVTNMERFNLSNGFIYAKKGSKIIKQNIDETIKRYKHSNNRHIQYIGGCFIMGSIIELNINDKLMPLGETKIGNENCLFLQEIGDKEKEKISKQEFWNSFGVYNDDIRIMNSRYDTYHIDRNKRNEFVSRND